MASTYLWSEIITYVTPYVKSIPTSSIDNASVDHVNSIIWRAFFWRWSLDDLTAISLVDGTQDYAVTDTNLYRLANLQITRTDVTPDVSRELDLVEYLSQELNLKGNMEIQAACYRTSSAGADLIRLDRAAAVPSGTTYEINGQYQFNPVKITTTSTIVFPDQYVDVAIEGIKWKYYQLGDDKRAGGPVADANGRVAYSGQYATFMALLGEMKRQEDFQNAQAQRFPGDSLGVGRSANPGLLGWI